MCNSTQTETLEVLAKEKKIIFVYKKHSYPSYLLLKVLSGGLSEFLENRNREVWTHPHIHLPGPWHISRGQKNILVFCDLMFQGVSLPKTWHQFQCKLFGVKKKTKTTNCFLTQVHFGKSGSPENKGKGLWPMWWKTTAEVKAHATVAGRQNIASLFISNMSKHHILAWNTTSERLIWITVDQSWSEM